MPCPILPLGVHHNRLLASIDIQKVKVMKLMEMLKKTGAAVLCHRAIYFAIGAVHLAGYYGADHDLVDPVVVGLYWLLCRGK